MALVNLGLGEAAKRGVGTTATNVPDIATADSRYMIKEAGVNYVRQGVTGVISKGEDLAWNKPTGAYLKTNEGDSSLIWHIGLNTGSASAAQFHFNYANGGLRYRSSRDAQGFEKPWARIYSDQDKPTAAEIGALAFHGGISKDLNEIFSPGAYCNVYDAYAIPAHHYPIAFAGSLFVYLNSANGSNGVTQEYRPYNSNKLFRRFYYVSSSLWSAWSEEYNTHNKPTAADIGALPINELIGIPMPWPQAKAPSGWLKCNGLSFDKNIYTILAKVYPSGILPDLRGEFIRGWDDGRQVDNGRGLLISQQATIVGVGDPNINYTALVSLYNNVDNNLSTIASNLNGEVPVKINDNAVKLLSGAGKFDPLLASQASMYVRPRNIAFNYIVRAA
ncbi:tail fiber protein [Pectobacterium parmentieri]|uniref:tail fiber protein n=2 Tax=Pectobacterium parmentieri TaxID=1905730 RepID=UPI0020BDD70D|nr:tail fiber protein [Pectobacterium parmentieri]